jgi:hypothetical protein
MAPDKPPVCAWCGNRNAAQLRVNRYQNGYICKDGDACVRRGHQQLAEARR